MLTAEVNGGDLKWFKDGVELKKVPGRIRIYTDGHNRSCLDIMKCTTEDTGVYIGKVKTTAGNCKTSPCHVEVE